MGLLEPDASKGARPVLRGAGRSNASGLCGDPPAYERPVEQEEHAAREAGQAHANAYIEAQESAGAREKVDQATIHRDLWKETLKTILVPEIVAVIAGSVK